MRFLFRYLVTVSLTLLSILLTNGLIFASSYVPATTCIKYSKRIPQHLLESKWKLKRKEISKKGIGYGEFPLVPIIRALYEEAKPRNRMDKVDAEGIPNIDVTIYFFLNIDEANKFVMRYDSINNLSKQPLSIDNVDAAVLLEGYTPNPAAIPNAQDIFNSFVIARKDSIVFYFNLIAKQKPSSYTNLDNPPAVVGVSELMGKESGSEATEKGIDIDFVKEFLKRLIIIRKDDIVNSTGDLSAQIKYLQAYGLPHQFILLFLDQGNSSQGQSMKVRLSRRIETWIYPKHGFRVMFDNGFFIKEVRLEPGNASEKLPSTSLKPMEFNPDTTQEEINDRFGKPDKTETVTVGSHQFEVYRYLNLAGGVKSFTFFDNQIVGVAAGFAIVPNEDALSIERQEEKI